MRLMIVDEWIWVRRRRCDRCRFFWCDDDFLINVISEIDKSIFWWDWLDVDNVDDNGWEEEDFVDRFGVDVNGMYEWKESILGSKDDLLMSNISVFAFNYVMKWSQ